MSDPSPSKEEKRAASLKMLNKLKQYLIKRFGTDFLIDVPENNCISVHWKTKRDGSLAIVSVLVSKGGSLRIEFTSNLVEGVITPAEAVEGDRFPAFHVELKPHSFMRVFRQENTQMMHGFWSNVTPAKENFAAHTPSMLFDIVNSLLMA
jgi:hypothetical protein